MNRAVLAGAMAFLLASVVPCQAQDRISMRGFADAGLTIFTATQSFKAILGSPAGPVFGGGVAINARGDVAFTAALHPPGNNQEEWGTGVYVAYAEADVLFRNGFE